MVEFDLRHKSLTLLLIDDDLVSREVTATVLTMGGYSIHTADSGESALAMVDERCCAPDAILMDTQMPGLCGAALIEALRKRTDAAIYAISASEPPAEIAIATDGFLQKPFDAEKLKRTLAGPRVRLQKATNAGASTEGPVVDTATLAQLRRMMPASAVQEIYEAVVGDLHKRIKALEGAIARGDSTEIRRIGHAIKGGCGLAGAVQAARLGAQFETASESEDGNELDNKMLMLRDLRAATERLERMLETELSDREGLASGGKA